VFKRIQNPDSNVEYNAQVLNNCCKQTYFGETYVPVRKLTSFWYLISMIGIHGLNIDHLDVVTVVLYSEVNHEVIHVMLPTNMQDGFQASVIAVRLKEALYGLKQTQ